MKLHSPIIIGCTGGSGSRVLQHTLSSAGYFMGYNLNASRDAMDFEPFLDEVINPILTMTRSVNYCFVEAYYPYADRLRKIIDNYTMAVPAQALGWGWKCPRNIYILPIIHAVYPQMRFIHLVRDGRDMALSHNQNQLRKHYEHYFNKKLPDVTPYCSIELWQAVNLHASQWAAQNLRKHYYPLKFENLCINPKATLEDVSNFLGEPLDIDALSSLVVTPETTGRYLSLDATKRVELEKIATTALSYFNYV